MATRKVIIYKGKLYFSDVTVPTRVSQLANDAGYVTTDENVKQTPTTSGGPYRILLSNSTDDTEHIEKVRKSSSLIYYPSGTMELTGTILGTETCKTTIHSYNIRINVTDDQNVSKYMDIWNDDINLSGNTWDGTNTSLKTSIGSLKQSLSNLFFQGAGKVTNLNLPDRTKGVIYINTYNAGATNAPNSSNGGYLFTFINNDSANYGIQVSVTNGGIHARRLQGGSYQTWVVVVSV